MCANRFDLCCSARLQARYAVFEGTRENPIIGLDELGCPLPVQKHVGKRWIERHARARVFGLRVAYTVSTILRRTRSVRSSQITSHHLSAKSSLQRSPVARPRITIVR